MQGLHVRFLAQYPFSLVTGLIDMLSSLLPFFSPFLSLRHTAHL